MTGKRTFRVVLVRQAGSKERGCKTKFDSKLVYTSSSPVSAAKKAFSSLCARKRIKGACGMFVTVKEITRGSKGKSYTYECHKKLLRGKDVKKIVMNGTLIVFKHTVKAKAVNEITGKVKKCVQSRGRMLSKKSSIKKKPSTKKKPIAKKR